MTDYPADILEKARGIYAEWPVKVIGGLEAGTQIRSLAQAIADERERCAAIAERLRDEKEDLLGYECFSDGCHEVAVAIRSGGE